MKHNYPTQQILKYIYRELPALEHLEAEYAIETNSGESYSGLIAKETPQQVMLRMPLSIEHSFQRTDIHSITTQGRSIMPEGLHEGLSHQDMADLLEFIITVGDWRIDPCYNDSAQRIAQIS